MQNRRHCGLRWRFAWAALLAAFLALALTPARAADDPGGPAAASAGGGATEAVRTNVLARIYQSANGRLSRGDTAGAVAVMRTIAEVAPDLAPIVYTSALAGLLNDFAKREAEIPALRQVLAAEPDNPLANVLMVFADPQMSQLQADGALYVSQAGAARLREAGPKLVSYPAARNGRYVAAFLASGEPTGNANYPVRYRDFNKMVGSGGQLKLANWSESVPFGQLFLMSVDETRFQPYESKLIARLQGGLKSLEDNESSLARLRQRIADLRKQLESADPSQRMVVLSNLDQILGELDNIIASNDKTITQLKVIVDNVDVKTDAQIAANRKQIQEQETQIAQLKTLGTALQTDLNNKKAAISSAEKQYLETVTRMNAAQKQLNDLQGKLAQTQEKLNGAERQSSGIEKTVKQGNDELAQIRARQVSLQQAAQNDQTKTELAQLASRKTALEGDLKGESAQLAGIRAERDKLQGEVDAIKREQDQKMAEHARLAIAMNKIDFGRYFALIIGNDDYASWPRLSTAVNDANTIADVLQKKYGYQVKVLANANRQQILAAFNDYIADLGPSDNLLIYYAGHGIIDDKGNGYWVPVDASVPRSTKTIHAEELIKHEDVIATIQKMHAKQVMVLADSCFSGGLAALAGAAAPVQVAQVQLPTTVKTRGLKIVDQDGDIPVGKIQGVVAATDADMSSDEVNGLMRLASLPARVVLTSGANEPVVDQINPKDKHSIFAASVLDALAKNHGLLKSIELTNAVQDEVIRKTGRAGRSATAGPQTPNFNNLMGYSGDFLFIARN